MKKIFFVFFVMFLTFGTLGNNASTNIGKKFEQSNTQLEQRFYWKTDITPIELQSQENKKQIIDSLNNKHFTLKNISKDTSYQLALSIGSDIYIEYNISKEKSSYDTKKIAVTLKI